MIKNSSAETKILDRLYEYSKQYVPFSWLEKINIKNISINKIRFIFRVFLFPFIFGGLIMFIASQLKIFQNLTVFYLFFLLSVVFCSSIGGLISGLINAIILTGGSLYIFQYGNTKEAVFFLVVSSITAFIIDKSRRTNEIRRLKKLEWLYAKKYTELYDMYEQSLSDIKARDEFLSIASHELKTPLTSMLLKLNKMINTIQHVSFARFSVPELLMVLANAQTQIRWLSTMINDLLNVSLMTTGKMDLYKKDVDLVDVTRQIMENFSETLKRDGYSVKLEADNPVTGYWDETRIEQVITNLISNAIKYGKNNPIDIKVVRSGNFGKFIIKDRGIGISPKDRSVIFKPFKRPKSVEGYKKGLGVGLYLSQLIADAHGGRIKVASVYGQGTTFTLELPIKTSRV